MYIREDQATITLTVNNAVYDNGNESWATYAGAGLTAAGSKTRPGGMGKQVALGGPASRADVTITTQLTETMVGQHGALEALVGKGNAKITVTYLDDEGVVIPGAQFIATGKLKEVTLPGQNYDSPTVGMYTVVVDADEVSS